MNIDTNELVKGLTQAIEAAKRIHETQQLVASILERTFDKETLDAIYLVMRGPEAIAELDGETRVPAINAACDKIANYHASMGRLQ